MKTTLDWIEVYKKESYQVLKVFQQKMQSFVDIVFEFRKQKNYF